MRNPKRNLVVVLAVCLAIAPLTFARPNAPSKALERADGVFDRVAFATQMIDLNDRLAAQQAAHAYAAPLRVIVTADELAGVRDDIAFERKIRVGISKDVRVPVDFSDILGRAPIESVRDFGAIRGNEDHFVWSGPVVSPGAAALRVHITDFYMPEGSELYVYTPGGMAFGPYRGLGPNGTGEFWTNTVVGSDVILQVHHEGPSTDRPSFVVSGIGYLTERFQLAKTLSPQSSHNDNCSFNEDCVVGAACANLDSAVDDAQGAVAQMLFVSGAFYYLCSGGLVADSDTSTAIPYFITANHCISKNGEAASLEAFFLYKDPSCTTCGAPTSPSTNGSSIVAKNRTSDYTLLQLSQAAPTGTAFLGWNSAEIAFTNGANLYRISHPAGAPQSYSEHVVDVNRVTCRSWPRGSWIYSSDVFGATEGGSSGSPVVNGAGELVGQLSGACGYNVGDPCDSAQNATVDGAFAAYYDQVAAYLGPGGGGPTPENCTDGIDNDGDGLIDCNDGDCASDPACDIGGGCTDADGDGHCSIETGGDDCDDTDNHVYPGHQDTRGRWGRDGVDNDCNGIIDG